MKKLLYYLLIIIAVSTDYLLSMNIPNLMNYQDIDINIEAVLRTFTPEQKQVMQLILQQNVVQTENNFNQLKLHFLMISDMFQKCANAEGSTKEIYKDISDSTNCKLIADAYLQMMNSICQNNK